MTLLTFRRFKIRTFISWPLFSSFPLLFRTLGSQVPLIPQFSSTNLSSWSEPKFLIVLSHSLHALRPALPYNLVRIVNSMHPNVPRNTHIYIYIILLFHYSYWYFAYKDAYHPVSHNHSILTYDFHYHAIRATAIRYTHNASYIHYNDLPEIRHQSS